MGTADERGRHEFDATTVANPSVFFHELEYGDKGASRLTRTGGVAGRKYDFHHSFSESDGNDSIYRAVVADLVPFVIKGGVATCIAYGQTGAGKTYTQVAMQDRLARDLLAAAASKVKAGRWPDDAAALDFSFFENQGERCFDLQNQRQTLALREDGDGAVHVVGLSAVTVGTVNELHAVLGAANKLRATAATQENPESSRSHAICTFSVGGSGGVLRVIDLAGSERHESNTEHTPERIAEMKDINWSLGCLKECIRVQREAAAKGGSRRGGARMGGAGAADGGEGGHVPYRRSKLTMLLKDCFTSPTVRTVFLGHVAPTARSAEYTKNTLDYASQMCFVAEKKKKSVHGIVPPDRWSKTQFQEWLGALEGGRFQKYLEIMQINGATMQNMPMSGKEGLTKRFEADGVPFARAEADAKCIMDAFHAEKDKAKAAIAKAAKEGSGPPLDPLLLAEVMAYYNEYNPLFANQPKIEGIARTFQNKAKKAGTPDDWREMLYAALGGKAGCEDPRLCYARAGGGAVAVAGAKEHEPEPESESVAPEADGAAVDPRLALLKKK
eukprot:COSAG05_NODE_17_length_35518_cov_34.728084_23_plen_557_part_00